MNLDQHFIIFFLDDFHRGAINHIIHFSGFTVLGYGLGAKNWKLVILSPFIMELGHLYNYTQGIHNEQAISIIPYQWLAWVIFVLLGIGISKLFSKKSQSK
jgi:hypothetical protein